MKTIKTLTVITSVLTISLCLEGCSFKKTEKVGVAAPALNGSTETAVKTFKNNDFKVQYSTNLKEERSLSRSESSANELKIDYPIIVPVLSDVLEDLGPKSNNEEAQKIAFTFRIKYPTEVATIERSVRFEGSKSTDELTTTLEDVERTDDGYILRVLVSAFHASIGFQTNKDMLLNFYFYLGSDEIKVQVPLRTASVIKLAEEPVFDEKSLKGIEHFNSPYSVIPVKKFVLENPSNEVLTFSTETKVAGKLFRYINEETEKSSDCSMVTHNRTAKPRAVIARSTPKPYKVAKAALFVLGKKDEDKQSLIEKATTNKRLSMTSILNEKENDEYVLYMVIRNNSQALDAIGSCGVLRTKQIPTTCEFATCDSAAWKWMQLDEGDDWGDCISGPGGNPMALGRDGHRLACKKCVGAQHWNVTNYGEVGEEAVVTGYGIEMENPFRSGTVQTGKIPAKLTHGKAARIDDIDKNINLTGNVDFTSKEADQTPPQCKLECIQNPNDPECGN